MKCHGEIRISQVGYWAGRIWHLLSTTAVYFIYGFKAAFPRAKFLCHISHALQSLLTDFCGIITVNPYSRTDTDAKWINNNYNFGINDCRACNLWQRKFGRVLEPLIYDCRNMEMRVLTLKIHVWNDAFRIISITIIIFIDYQIIMTEQKEWEKARIK